MKREVEKKSKRISLYPLKFSEVIADVLKAKPPGKTTKKKKAQRDK